MIIIINYGCSGDGNNNNNDHDGGNISHYHTGNIGIH